MGEPSTRVYIDSRYSGNHGIARYAREVIPRLDVHWRPLRGRLEAATPFDALNPQRMRLPRSAVLYSPGYSAGISRCTQLLTIHDLIHLRTWGSKSDMPRAIYYENIVKPAIKRAGHVITVSDTSASDIKEWLGNDIISVHNAGIGCSTAFSHEGPRHSPGRPYFLYVGNLKPHKNPKPLFEVMTFFRDHLLVAALPAADIAAARALADQHGISDRLETHHNVNDSALAALYRGADALVFPSRWEGFGLPVLEALMTGTSVVYYRGAASVAEICRGGQFAVEDADDVQQFREQMTLAACSGFDCSTDLSQFSWDRVASEVNSVIDELLA